MASKSTGYYAKLQYQGENSFGGRRYYIQGVLQFSSLDATTLEHGDSITDNEGKGMTVYVHRCATCGEVTLRGMMVMVAGFCSRHENSYASPIKGDFNPEQEWF